MTNRIPLMQILRTLGHTPLWESANKASFRIGDRNFLIDKVHNRWVLIDDHRYAGRGSDLVAFLNGISKEAADDWLAAEFSGIDKAPEPNKAKDKRHGGPGNYAKIVRCEPLTSRNLVRRLLREGIALDVAQKYCREVSYCDLENGTSGYGIAIMNRSGGCGLIRKDGKPRNVGKQDVAVLPGTGGGHERCHLFIGILDALTFLSLNPHKEDVFVMFSSGLVGWLEYDLPNYDEVVYYTPYSGARKDTFPTLERCCRKLTDLSPMYRGYDDYHQWVLAGSPQKVA